MSEDCPGVQSATGQGKMSGEQGRRQRFCSIIPLTRATPVAKTLACPLLRRQPLSLPDNWNPLSAGKGATNEA